MYHVDYKRTPTSSWLRFYTDPDITDLQVFLGAAVWASYQHDYHAVRIVNSDFNRTEITVTESGTKVSYA